MIIYAHGYDIPGIGAAITRILYEKNCGIEVFKMITCEGFFTILVTVSCREYRDKSEMEELIRDAVKEFGVDIKVTSPSSAHGNIQKSEWIPYKISIVCDDQTLALCSFMSEMAKFRINISDVRCQKYGAGMEKTHEIIIKIELPIIISVDILKSALEDLGRTVNAQIEMTPISGLEG